MRNGFLAKTVQLLGVLALGMIIAGGYYYYRGCGSAARQASRMDGSLHKLGLSAEQKDKILALDEKHRVGLAATGKQIAAERLVLSRCLTAPEWDRGEIKASCEKIAALQCRQQVELIDHLAKIKGILTPEQRERFFYSICGELCRECQGRRGKGGCDCGLCDGGGGVKKGWFK